jgi:hypothetical protein
VEIGVRRMGCVESSRRVKTIRVVQQAAKNGPELRRGSKGLLSGSRSIRTPLPNMVDSGFEDELTAIATIDLGVTLLTLIISPNLCPK